MSGPRIGIPLYRSILLLVIPDANASPAIQDANAAPVMQDANAVPAMKYAVATPAARNAGVVLAEGAVTGGA